jgi:acetyl esterase/lipase
LLMTMISVSSAVTQQPGATSEDPQWVKELAPKRIVHSVPGMERVQVRKDLTYKRVGGDELKMDVYSPPLAESRRRRPAVIFIHGGRVPQKLRTKPKDWGVFISYGQLVAASGLVGVTFNHRFYAWESLRDSQSDLNDLIAYVRDHADSLGVDQDRIVLWAVSAGAIFLSQTLRDPPPYIRCLVSFYGELDLQSERKSAPQSVSDETLREFSPLYYVGRSKQGTPPIFLARAGLDDPDLNASADRFLQTAVSNNLAIEFMNHPTGHHGFDVDDNNDRSREIIKRAIEFIKAHG